VAGLLGVFTLASVLCTHLVAPLLLVDADKLGSACELLQKGSLLARHEAENLYSGRYVRELCDFHEQNANSGEAGIKLRSNAQLTVTALRECRAELASLVSAVHDHNKSLKWRFSWLVTFLVVLCVALGQGCYFGWRRMPGMVANGIARIAVAIAGMRVPEGRESDAALAELADVIGDGGA
jgi:hypothetical protein